MNHMRSNVQAIVILLLGLLLSAACFVPAAADTGVNLWLTWPEADQDQLAGECLVEATYNISEPGITLDYAGFFINETPFTAGSYWENAFDVVLEFQAGEYDIQPYIVDTNGNLHLGNTVSLRFIEHTENTNWYDVPGIEDISEIEPYGPSAPSPDLPTEAFKLSIDFDGWLPSGDIYGTRLEFPPTPWYAENIEPQFTWDVNKFEATLIYREPGPELVDSDRGGSAEHEWTHSYRIWGELTPDHTAMDITFHYSGECRRKYDDKLFEHYWCDFALTNVPGQGGMVTPVANPYGPSQKPRYAVNYSLKYHGDEPRDHLLELNYGHEFPSDPTTKNVLTTAKITDVEFTFNGW
ncbi:hypothetical protein JW859_00120 [bacterium]|nr:hypothetical protein [bacterium]